MDEISREIWMEDVELVREEEGGGGVEGDSGEAARMVEEMLSVMKT